MQRAAVLKEVGEVPWVIWLSDQPILTMCGKQDDKNKQITVVCHVDDLKVSYVDSFEITKFAGYMSSIFLGVTVHMVKLNGILGMGIYYSKQGTVQLFMIKYLDNVLQEFPDHLGATAATPATDYLFKIHIESERQYLPE